MTQQPPTAQIDYGRYDAPRKTSGAAIASLVLGIIGCIPLITGLLAVIFGVVGIRKTRVPGVRGRGLAVAGLILGMFSLVIWTCWAALLGYAYVQSKPAELVAEHFVRDLASGNINSALANSSGFTPAQLQSFTQQMASFGSFQSVGNPNFSVSIMNGQKNTHLTETAVFPSGPRTCEFNLIEVNGTYKVSVFKVY